MIKKIKKNHKAALTVVLIAVAFGLFFIVLNTRNNKTTVTKNPDIGSVIINSNSQIDELPNDDIPSLKDDPTDSTINTSITRANRSTVSVYIEKIENGTCKLTITQNNINVLSIDSKTTAMQDYSTCEGFSIDSTKLDSSPFMVTVDVFSDGRKGTASKEVR